MIHNVILALCIAAALAVLLVALWTYIGNKVEISGSFFSGHALAHPFEQLRGSRRHLADVVMRTPSERSLPGGWLLIHRDMRARRDVRIAIR